MPIMTTSSKYHESIPPRIGAGIKIHILLILLVTACSPPEGERVRQSGKSQPEPAARTRPEEDSGSQVVARPEPAEGLRTEIASMAEETSVEAVREPPGEKKVQIESGAAKPRRDTDPKQPVNLKRKAHELRSRLDSGGDPTGKINAEFEETVRALRPALQRIKINREYGTNRFQKFVLNEDGAGFDGVYFRAPEGNKPYEMVWLFGLPVTSSVSGWYILSVKEPTAQFRRFQRLNSPSYFDQLPWSQLDEEHVSIIQPLRGGQISPGREYIIWFQIQSDQPFNMFAAINLHSSDRYLGTLRHWEKALGLDR